MSSLTHVWLGTVLMVQGRLDEAAPEFGEGLQIARRRGDRLSTYVALYNLAQAAVAGQAYPQARRHLEEGIDLSEQTSDLSNLAYFLDALAVVESAAGAHERVAVLVGAAQTFRETGGSVYSYYVPDETLRAAAEQQARSVLGDAGFDAAISRGQNLDLAAAVRFALRPAG